MTYAQFLMIFVLPCLVLQVLLWRRNPPMESHLLWRGMVILCALAVVYTSPWDNYLVMSGVWSYQPGRVLGRIGYVPMEEYGFFLLQTIFTGFWVSLMTKVFPVSEVKDRGRRTKWLGFAIFGALLLGAFSVRNEVPYHYFSLILLWALPVVMIQWYFGADCFLANLKLIFWGLFPPTFYLCIADGLAIHFGIWQISEAQTMGLRLWGFPLEEGIFFFVTNLMVVFGLTFLVALKREYAKTYQLLRLGVHP